MRVHELRIEKCAVSVCSCVYVRAAIVSSAGINSESNPNAAADLLRQRERKKKKRKGNKTGEESLPHTHTHTRAVLAQRESARVYRTMMMMTL